MNMSTSPSIPNLGDLSPFEKMPEVPERCFECPIAQSFVRDALAKRAIAQALLDATQERPDNDELVEALQERSEISEMLRMFFMEVEDYEESQLETPEQLIAAMHKNQGQGIDHLIEEANKSTLSATRLLNNCETGPNSTIMPRPNRRPVRLTYCDGAVNNAGFQEDVETTVIVEEID